MSCKGLPLPVWRLSTSRKRRKPEPSLERFPSGFRCALTSPSLNVSKGSQSATTQLLLTTTSPSRAATLVSSQYRITHSYSQQLRRSPRYSVQSRPSCFLVRWRPVGLLRGPTGLCPLDGEPCQHRSGFHCDCRRRAQERGHIKSSSSAVSPSSKSSFARLDANRLTRSYIRYFAS